MAQLSGRRSDGLLIAALLCTASAAPTVRGLMDLGSPSVPAQACPVFPPQAGQASPPASQDVKAQIGVLERQLAQLPRDSEAYRMLKSALDDLKKRLSAGNPATPAARTLSYRKLSTTQALVNLYVNLADHLSPQAWDSWTSNRALADPKQANQTAFVAAANGKPLLSVAAYLKLLESRPKDRDALFNLASLAASLGAPNEALALLDASLAQGGPSNTFYPPEAQALTVRGYALLWVKRSKEAEEALTRAVKLAPRLSEAQRNLASALANQGKCGQARAALVRSLSRHDIPKRAPEQASTPAPPTPPPAGLPLPAPPAQSSADERSLRDLLDFRRGTVGVWPYWPTHYDPYDEAQLERRGAELQQMLERLDQKINVAAFQQAPERLRRLLNSVEKEPLTAARVRLLYTGQYQLFREKRFSQLYSGLNADLITYQKTELDARQRLKRALDDASQDYRRRSDACGTDSFCQRKAEYDYKSSACSSIVNWNDQWKNSASFLMQSVRPIVTETDLFYSTVISYASLPELQGLLRLNHQATRTAFLRIVPGYLQNHLSELDRINEPCEYVARTSPPKPGPDEAAASYTPFDPAGCSPAATFTAKLLVLGFGANCEKVYVEVEKSLPWTGVSAFVNFEQKSSAGAKKPPTARDQFIKALGAGQVRPEKLPEFGVPKSNLTLYTVSAGVSASTGKLGNGVSVRDSLYLTVDSNGTVVDAGIRGETAQSVGAEFDLGMGAAGVGVLFDGVSSNVSFLPSVPGS